MTEFLHPHTAQLAGAFCIMAAYFALQMNRMREDKIPYLFCNFAGGLLLFYAAVLSRQIGFILLEGAWTGISLAGMVRRCFQITRK